MKELNNRCPLQSECGYKCKYQHHERDCNYYCGNARPGMDIPDQEKLIVDEYETAMSPANILSASPAEDQPEPDMIQVNTGLPVYLPVEKLFPHPYNPRKDLGDLTELADGIKANGILQNLTVIPMKSVNPDSDDDSYVVIIGHRRLAAAKLAGLTEVPCVITEMGDSDQIQTMLAENGQRADLNVQEQAQGFQMMLDLGESVNTISQKSGFSKSYVRSRLKITKLDQEKVKASVERGARIQDYLELEKIEDPELKNRVLDAIGTNNFRMTLNNAINEEKNRKYIAEVVEVVRGFATLVEKADYSAMQYVNGYEAWNKKKKAERPDDADTVKYYYTANSQTVSLYREKVETDEDVAAKEEQARRQAEFNRRESELKSLAETTYKLRLDFIKGYSKAKKNLPLVIQFAGLALCECNGSADFEILAGLLDIQCDLENEEFDMGAYNAAMLERPEYTLLATAYATADYEGLAYHRRTYRMEDGKYDYHLDHEENAQLTFVYDRLIALGYEMSDVEKALQDGTHELFKESAPTPQAEQEATPE